jgi:hypothetical protein
MNHHIRAFATAAKFVHSNLLIYKYIIGIKYNVNMVLDSSLLYKVVQSSQMHKTGAAFHVQKSNDSAKSSRKYYVLFTG